MKLASWEYYGISGRKMLLVSGACGLGVGYAVLALGSVVLGGTAPELALLTGLAAAYLVGSTPRRMRDAETLAQAREATSLAGSISAGFSATRSRARTILFLRSKEPVVASLVREAKRRVLLGWGVPEAIQSVEARLASYSARNVLNSLAGNLSGLDSEAGEETQGISKAAELSEETKLPLFTSLAFFLPIMLVLYAVLGHRTDSESLAALVGVEFVILDLGFYYSSSERAKLR